MKNTYAIIATHIDCETKNGDLIEFNVFESDNEQLAREVYKDLAAAHNDFDYDPVTIFLTVNNQSKNQKV